jgi:hypothetical protein
MMASRGEFVTGALGFQDRVTLCRLVGLGDGGCPGEEFGAVEPHGWLSSTFGSGVVSLGDCMLQLKVCMGWALTPLTWATPLVARAIPRAIPGIVISFEFLI